MQLKYRKPIYYFGVFLYFIAFWGTFASPALTYTGHLQLCRRIFIFSILLTLPAMFCLGVVNRYISERIKLQVFGCYLILSIIFFPIFIRSFISGYHHYYIFHWIECFALLAGSLFWFFSICNKRQYLGRLGIWIKSNKILILLCCIVFILSIEQITKYLRWDTIHYYAYIERLCDFTFNPNDIALFKASGHVSYAYVLIYSIGESILPGFGYGVRIENIIIFIIGIMLLNCLLKLTLSQGKNVFRYLSLALFAFTPVILGPIHNIDVELLTLTLVIAVIYCYFRHFYILGLLCATFLVFTKETCTVLLAAFIIGEVIRIFYIHAKAHKITAIFHYQNWRKMLTLYLPLLLFVFYYSLDVAWGSTKAAADVDPFNQWGVNAVVIINKIKQLFIMNFSWIPVSIIIIGICSYILKKLKRQKAFLLDNSTIITVISIYIAFILNQLFYMTYPFPRYIMLQYFFMTIFLQWALNLCLLKKLIKIIICIFSIGLTIVQNFVSIDIVSNYLFDTMPIGQTDLMVNSPIVYLNNTTVLTGEDAAFLALSPYADFNRQWSYFDELINKFLNQINYDENDLVLFPDTFWPRSANIYFGMWTNTYYDKQTKCLKQLMDSSLLKPDDMIYFNAQIVSDDNNIKTFDNVYYLQFPFREDYSDYILKKYDVIDTISVSYRGWNLVAYKIKGQL